MAEFVICRASLSGDKLDEICSLFESGRDVSLILLYRTITGTDGHCPKDSHCRHAIVVTFFLMQP